jgi:Holliday junction resolvase RusA-like endonuclease
MIPIQFFTGGDPKAQPRPRAFARQFGSKWQARVYEAGTAEGWKSSIAQSAKVHCPEKPLTGPIHVDLIFFFRRPKNHFRSGKHSDELRKDAPRWHSSKPDRDNLDKAVLDALTQLGFFEDDSQVCSGTVEKRWVNKLGLAGCSVLIRQHETI